jgi:hypothetical protein
MGKRKGHFSRSGVGETVWGAKSRTLTATLSEDGWRLAKERAKKLGISISEILERWGRKFDVNFNDSDPLPPELDSTSNLVKSMSIFELHEALGQKLQEKAVSEDFVRKLSKGKVTNADVAELSGLLDLEESEAQRLIEIVTLIKGGKKPNGV